MFFDLQDTESRRHYEDVMKLVGSLSNLYSESKAPLMHYRGVENIFCEAFNAKNLAREDIALDARKGDLGIGIKTFTVKGNTSQEKVAEFNREQKQYVGKKPEEVMRIVSELRNKRISDGLRLAGIDGKPAIYHCLGRYDGQFKVFEEPMDFIDLETLRLTSFSDKGISFRDDVNAYNFNFTKSTLLKTFKLYKPVHEFDVEILENPLKLLREIVEEGRLKNLKPEFIDTIYLPLYGSEGKVHPKSGLNCWNADGRKRDPNECYIPIPKKFRELCPNFFPSKDTPFLLHLPTGDTLSAKICQDGGKALMSNPNDALGKWILREVLQLPEGQVATNKDLDKLGIDSVRVDKINEEEFQIGYSQIGTFEKFMKSRPLESSKAD